MDPHHRSGITTRLAFAASTIVLALGPVLLATESPSDPVRADATPMLEPSTLLLVGLGLVGIAIFRSRNRASRTGAES